MKYYFDRASTSKVGMLVFQEEKTVEDNRLEALAGTLEKYYTKGDLFDYFGVKQDVFFYNSEIFIHYNCLLFINLCKISYIRSWWSDNQTMVIFVTRD